MSDERWAHIKRIAVSPLVVEELIPEIDRLRAALDYRDGALDVAEHDKREAEAALARVKEARANHPACDVHPDDEPVSCGWKRTVLDIDAALEGDTDD